MPILGYTSYARVELALGRSFTDEESVLYDAVAEAAEQYINACTGRGWLGGPVTAERHTIQSGRVWLYQRPITAVTAVRHGLRFATGTLLTGATDYVVDVTRGLLTFASGWTNGEVEVDYTVPTSVPADITHAATELTKAWLSIGAAADLSNLKSWSIDGQRFEYRDGAELGAVPGTVEKLLARWRRPVLA